MVGGSGTRDSKSIQSNTSLISFLISSTRSIPNPCKSDLFPWRSRRIKSREPHPSFAPDQLWFRLYFLLLCIVTRHSSGFTAKLRIVLFLFLFFLSTGNVESWETCGAPLAPYLYPLIFWHVRPHVSSWTFLLPLPLLLVFCHSAAREKKRGQYEKDSGFQ